MLKFKFLHTDDTHEFEPILSEIENKPINPLGRAIFWTLLSLIFATILILYFGKVDVVITAPSKAIPDGNIKIIQPLEIGVVDKIWVKEGDFVKKGSTLVTINPSAMDPQLESTRRIRSQIQSELGRLYDKKARQKQVLDIIAREDYERTLSEISQQEKELSQIQGNLKEIEFKSTQQKIISPVEGYVNTILISTVGGVVTPAQQLMSVIPADTPLLVKATVLNKDIGFVKEGMSVALKVDTFDFQKYGMLEGTVKTVSKDSIENEQLGLIYEVFIAPKTTTLTVEGKPETLKPGMSVTAEIKTKKRRIIEFFIYPLVKHLKEGVSVR